jgi:hypothetical protein
MTAPKETLSRWLIVGSLLTSALGQKRSAAEADAQRQNSRTRPRIAHPRFGAFFFARLGGLTRGTPGRNRKANVAVGEEAPRSRVMAFCWRHRRYVRGLQQARASIVLARLHNVRRGGDFGNSRKTTEGLASASVRPFCGCNPRISACPYGGDRRPLFGIPAAWIKIRFSLV